jgi:hypothetical protein
MIPSGVVSFDVKEVNEEYSYCVQHEVVDEFMLREGHKVGKGVVPEISIVVCVQAQVFEVWATLGTDDTGACDKDQTAPGDHMVFDCTMDILRTVWIWRLGRARFHGHAIPLVKPFEVVCGGVGDLAWEDFLVVGVEYCLFSFVLCLYNRMRKLCVIVKQGLVLLFEIQEPLHAPR